MSDEASGAGAPTIVVDAHARADHLERALLGLLSHLTDGLARSGFAEAAQSYPQLAEMFAGRQGRSDPQVLQAIVQLCIGCRSMLRPVLDAVDRIEQHARMPADADAPAPATVPTPASVPTAAPEPAAGASIMPLAGAALGSPAAAPTPEPAPPQALIDIGALGRTAKARPSRAPRRARAGRAADEPPGDAA